MISFIIAAYNEEKHIVECVESCLNQDEVETEVVITDDGSVDGTWDVLYNNYSRNPRVVLSRFDENRGKIHAYNNSYQHASGDYIAIMGADDVNEPCRCAEQIKELLYYELCIITLNKVNSDNTEIIEVNPLRCSDELRKEIDLHHMIMGPFGLPGIMFTRELASSIFPLPTDLAHEDWWIPFKAVLRKPFIVVNKPLYRYRMHENNTSGSNLNHTYTSDQKRRLAYRDLTFYQNVKIALLDNGIDQYLHIIDLHIIMLRYLKAAFEENQYNHVILKNFLKKLKSHAFPANRNTEEGLLVLHKLNEYRKQFLNFDLRREVSIIDRIVPDARDQAANYFRRLDFINKCKNRLKILFTN